MQGRGAQFVVLRLGYNLRSVGIKLGRGAMAHEGRLGNSRVQGLLLRLGQEALCIDCFCLRV